MKYLYTFVAVSEPLRHRLDACQPPTAKPMARHQSSDSAGAHLADSSGGAAQLEEIIHGALREDIDSIAFFRSIMDGWDNSHTFMQSWFQENRPAAYTKWRRYVNRDVLVISWKDMQCFLPRPKRRDIARLIHRSPMNAYAIHAIIDALYDAIQFAQATKTTLIALACCLGPTLADHEYG